MYRYARALGTANPTSASRQNLLRSLRIIPKSFPAMPATEACLVDFLHAFGAACITVISRVDTDKIEVRIACATVCHCVPLCTTVVYQFDDVQLVKAGRAGALMTTHLNPDATRGGHKTAAVASQSGAVRALCVVGCGGCCLHGP